MTFVYILGGLFWGLIYGSPIALVLGIRFYTKTQKKSTKEKIIIFLSAWPAYILLALSLYPFLILLTQGEKIPNMDTAAYMVVSFFQLILFFTILLLIILFPLFYFRHKERIKVLILSILWWWIVYAPAYFIASHVIDNMDAKTYEISESKP